MTEEKASSNFYGEDEIVMSKTWAMPNGKTFTIRPIKEFIGRYVFDGMTVVDPFANESKIGTIRNDLNPEYDCQFHMDALSFLQSLDSDCADVVLFDPPYSITQAAQLYRSYGKERLDISVANMAYWARCKDECARILKLGGHFLCFGWNTNGLGKGRGFAMREVLIVSHGGSKNDTLCTAEIKARTNQQTT